MKQHAPNWLAWNLRQGYGAFPVGFLAPSSFKCSRARAPTTHPLLVGPLLHSPALKDDPHAASPDLTSIHPTKLIQ